MRERSCQMMAILGDNGLCARATAMPQPEQERAICPPRNPATDSIGSRLEAANRIVAARQDTERGAESHRHRLRPQQSPCRLPALDRVGGCQQEAIGTGVKGIDSEGGADVVPCAGMIAGRRQRKRAQHEIVGNKAAAQAHEVLA
jgi:hypothetical protein